MKCYINANGVTTRACQKSQQYAPKGQKLIAQGNTLGKSIANHYAPCKGKSVNYQCFCPCRAFCYFQSVHPRRCLGLCAFWAFSLLCLTFDIPPKQAAVLRTNKKNVSSICSGYGEDAIASYLFIANSFETSTSNIVT